MNFKSRIGVMHFLKVKFWEVSGNQIAWEHIVSGYSSASLGHFIMTETALIGEHHA